MYYPQFSNKIPKNYFIFPLIVGILIPTQFYLRSKSKIYEYDNISTSSNISTSGNSAIQTLAMDGIAEIGSLINDHQ